MRLLPLLILATLPATAQITPSSPSFTGESGLFFTVDASTTPFSTWTVGFSAANFDQLYPEAPELRPPSDRPFRGFDVDRGEFRLFAAYGLTSDWEVSVAVPYIYYNQNIGDVAGFVEGYPRVGEFVDEGFGDLEIATKFRFFGTDDMALAGSFGADLPTGETAGGITSGDWSARAGVHLDVGDLTVSTAYRHRGERDAGDTPLGVAFDLADELNLDVGYEYRRAEWTSTVLIAELNGLVFRGGDRSADDALYGTVGLRHRWGGSCWTTDFAVNYNLTMGASDNPSHPIGGLFSISCRTER